MVDIMSAIIRRVPKGIKHPYNLQNKKNKVIKKLSGLILLYNSIIDVMYQYEYELDVEKIIIYWFCYDKSA